MKKALVVIDYTLDFVADEGKLTAGKPAQAIEQAIIDSVQKAYNRGDYVVFAIDAHEEGDNFHPETKLFPPHNIIGTQGRDLYGDLAPLYHEIKESSQVLWLDKRRYSAFSGTGLDARLRERGIKTVVLTGVLTDICVLHTAIEAYHLGYEIEVLASAVASVTEERHAWALSHIQSVLGAVVAH